MNLVHPCQREPFQVSPVRQQTFSSADCVYARNFTVNGFFFMWSFWVDIKLQWFGQLSDRHYFADTYKLRVTPNRISAQSWNSTKKYLGQTIRKAKERGSCSGGKNIQQQRTQFKNSGGRRKCIKPRRGWRKKYVQAKQKRHKKILVERWLTATSLQRPLSSVPKEAVVERLNCTCKVKTPPPHPALLF